MEGPAQPLGVSYYTKYSSTDTLLTSVKSQKDSSCPRHVMQTGGSSHYYSLSQRLRLRKDMLHQRKRIVDISFMLGIAGITFVVLDTELRFSQIIMEDSPFSILLKVLTSVSTFCLLLSIIAYHVTGLRLHMASAGFQGLLQDWRLVMTITKWVKLAFELLICVLHPLPFPAFSLPTMIVRDGAGGKQELQATLLPINCVLTILMFLRVYLLGRFIVVHSKLFLDTSVQSLGALSRVKINAQFVFRALMSTSPMVVLGSWMLGTFFINSWNLRVCELYTDPESDFITYGQSMWLTAVTFLTVGYGDLVPRSYCARVIASLTGMMGVGSMALTVAVLAKKLEQSRAERYVHTFVQQVNLDKKRRHAAADVVKHTFQIMRLRRAGKACNSKEMISHRSRLIQSLRTMHEAQFLKTAQSEFTVGTVEVNSGVNAMQESVNTIQSEQKNLGQRVANLETLLLTMSRQVSEICDLLKERDA